MRRVRCKHNPAAPGPYTQDLQSRRLAAHSVKSDSRHQLGVTLVKYGLLGINKPHHIEGVVQIEGRAQGLMAHAPAGGERHRVILQVKARPRKAAEIAGVVVVHVRDDDVAYVWRIHPQNPQGFRRATQPFALSTLGCLFAKSCIDDETTVVAAHDPHKIVEIGGELMWVGQNEIFARMPIPETGVANSENFKWLNLHVNLAAANAGQRSITAAPCSLARL